MNIISCTSLWILAIKNEVMKYFFRLAKKIPIHLSTHMMSVKQKRILNKCMDIHNSLQKSYCSFRLLAYAGNLESAMEQNQILTVLVLFLEAVPCLWIPLRLLAGSSGRQNTMLRNRLLVWSSRFFIVLYY